MSWIRSSSPWRSPWRLRRHRRRRAQCRLCDRRRPATPKPSGQRGRRAQDRIEPRFRPADLGRRRQGRGDNAARRIERRRGSGHAIGPAGDGRHASRFMAKPDRAVRVELPAPHRALFAGGRADHARRRDQRPAVAARASIGRQPQLPPRRPPGRFRRYRRRSIAATCRSRSNIRERPRRTNAKPALTISLERSRKRFWLMRCTRSLARSRLVG